MGREKGGVSDFPWLFTFGWRDLVKRKDECNEAVNTKKEEIPGKGINC